jgi:alanyl-tRNA synthetase
VLDVVRTPEGVVHRVTEQLEEGSDASIEVDWERRYDHMQQHSGTDQRSWVV